VTRRISPAQALLALLVLGVVALVVITALDQVSS
jgi:hypothetical protein